MREVYAALYDEELNVLEGPAVLAPEELLNWDLSWAYLTGSGSKLLKPSLEERGIPFVPVPEAPLDASGLFTLAAIFPREENYDFQQLASLEPFYLRESTAQVRRQGN